MPIRFRCQDCQSRVKVPEGSQGKQVKCPRCGRIQAVPRHQSQMADQKADGVTVHTCVGSMHRAPKRKEALVGAGVESDHSEFESGGGTPGGDRLDIPEQPSNDFAQYKHKQRPSRKERRRIAAREREAQREREEAIARKEEAEQQDLIAESRKQVEDLFATSHKKQYEPDDTEFTPKPEPKVEAEAPKPPIAPAQSAPESIALSGGGQPIDSPSEPTEPKIESQAAQQQVDEIEPAPVQTHEPETTDSWSIDLTSEAYPFLRIIPWVLRITALMLIGPAFKAMLVADAQGFSGVVCMLVLFAGLAIVVVTWTVGEIATAVRDIALRRATG